MTFFVIQAHRVLLASSSPYFKVGFTNCHTNSHQSVFFKREKRKFNLFQAMFTSGLKESQWTEEDGRTVQVDFYEDDDIDDEDDDDDGW